MTNKSNLPDIVQIQKKNIKTEVGLITLKYLNPVNKNESILKETLRNAPHLHDLLRLFDGEIHKRVIVICDDLNFGISAIGQIGKCMTGLLEKSSAFEINIDFDDDDNFSFDDTFTDYDHNNHTDEITDNFIIVFESEFDPGCNNVGEVSFIEQMNFKMPKLDYSDFKNLIFVADGIFTLTERSIDFLQGFNGNVAVIVTKNKKNDTAIKQLSFESNFEVVTVKNPTIDFLINQFKALAATKGCTINEKINLKTTIEELMRFRGVRFQEYDLSIYLDKSINLNKNKSKEIKSFLSISNNKEKITSQILMDNIVGLESIKKTIFQVLYKNIHLKQMAERGHNLLENYKHIAFEGNPGTCKTSMARAVASLYLENNIVTNGFYECSREDIVGRYLGETSQKVSKLFKMAKGGVVFIDEIGALLTGDSIDSYGEEALNAIVKHMENSPETMVIMATYPNEMEKIISINPGLKSRLSDIIKFPDYSNEELLEIFKSFTSKGGYSLEDGFEEIVTSYFNGIRSDKNFGNGREARKLFENAISQLSVELFKNKSKDIDKLTLSAISNAISNLTKNIKDTSRPSIGFTVKR